MCCFQCPKNPKRCWLFFFFNTEDAKKINSCLLAVLEMERFLGYQIIFMNLTKIAVYWTEVHPFLQALLYFYVLNKYGKWIFS